MITDIWIDSREPPGVVIFTENSSLYNELKKLKQCRKAIPYVRDREMIGGDVYFPLHFKKDLEKILNNLRIKC